VALYVIFRIDETPGRVGQSWLARNEMYSAMIAAGIFLVVAVMVIGLTTDLL
jgi:hypothetical protein